MITDEDDENSLTLAEKFEVWSGTYHIVDDEEEEESDDDMKRNEIHTPDWVESKMGVGTMVQTATDNVDEGSKADKRCIQKEKVDKELRKRRKNYE